MRRILYCIMLMFALIDSAYGQTELPMITMSKNKVSIGVKAGFNASLSSTKHLYIGGTKLEDITQNNKVGYTIAVFTRFNFKSHHYLQPELSFDITKSSQTINHSAENNDAIADNALIKTSIQSLNLPVLYGYKFIDKGLYGMSFVVGPQVAWFIPKKSKNTYEGFYQQHIKEEFKQINFSAVVGLSVNVSNIYFDMRYAIGLHPITQSITYDKNATPEPYNTESLRIKRSRNILSFAIGAIF